MTIPVTETKVFTRTSTNVGWPISIGTAAMNTFSTKKQAYLTAGNVTQTENLSGDGLTNTFVYVYNNLTTYSNFDTELNVALDSDFVTYADSSSINCVQTQSGISQPFTCTNTYTFPTAGAPVHDALSTELSNNTNGKLSNLVVTSTSITSIHTYNDSADFSSNYWKDLPFTKDLHTAGATRTITYALV